MANFFANPVIPRVTNPEPAGFNLIRQMLMNQMFQRNANPYGMNPGGQTGGNPLFPSGGRGTFDPYGGMNPGVFSGGSNPGMGGGGYKGRVPNPGGGYGPGANPGMGGGGYKGRIPGGGSTGNNFMQMLQNFLQQYQGGGQGGGRGVGFRQGGDVTGGVGIGTRTPSPGTGGIEPGAGGTNTEDQGGGDWQAPPWPQEPTTIWNGPGGMTESTGGRMPISAAGGGRSRPGGPTFAAPPATPETPYTPGSSGFDGAPEYDGRADVSKMMHAHQKMMTSVLPMLLQAPRVAAAAPSTTAGGPMPGYDGAMLTRPGGGYAPYDGMAPENAPSWTPLAERSGGTGLNLSESNTPNSLPASRDVPPLPRPGYDGNDDAAYGGFRHVRAPNVAPRPSMGVRPPMNAAAALQRILAGQAGANRRGGVAQSRVGSKGSAFDGSMEQPRGPAPSYDGERWASDNARRRLEKDIRAAHDAGLTSLDPDTLLSLIFMPRGPEVTGGSPAIAELAAKRGGDLGFLQRATWAGGVKPPGSPGEGPGLIFPARDEDRYDGVSYDASGSNVSSVPIGGDPTPITGTPPTGVDTGGSASPYPTGAQTGGQAMYPWLMPYTGQRTAAMSPYEIQGLEGMSDFVGGGMGLGGSRKYLDDLLSGKYVGSDNPYMADFQKGAQTLKESEDAMARQRIGSSMAAGGNALSGARIASEQQYQNTSDAQFQKMLAEMQMQNLARERALQQGGVGLSGNLAGEQLGGLSALMNAGAVPRGIQQGDFNSQYQDWLRQIGSMNQQDQFQQNLATQMLHTSPGAYQPGYGTSAAEGIAALLAGSGAGKGLLDTLKNLLGGGSKGGGGGGPSGGGGGGPAGGPGGAGGASGNIGPSYTDKNGTQWIRDPDTGAYVPQDTGYNEQTFNDWLNGGGSSGDPGDLGGLLSGGYDPFGPPGEVPGDPGYGEFGFTPTGGYDPYADTGGGGSNDIGWDWGAGPGGDYMTGGYDDYSNYGDYSGDTSGWG